MESKTKKKKKKKTETDTDHDLKTAITFRELGGRSISGPGVHNLSFVLTGALFCPTIPTQTHTHANRSI